MKNEYYTTNEYFEMEEDQRNYLELDEEDELTADDLELDEEDQLTEDDLELDEEDELTEDDLELDEEDELTADDLELDEEDELTEDDLELDEEDELTEDDLELDEEDELTEDDLELDEEDESVHSTSRGRRRMNRSRNNVGLVIPQNEKEELDRTLEEILNQQSTPISAGRGYAAPLKIVVADTSVRLELSRELTKMLNNPSSLYIGTNSTGLLITNADDLSVQSVSCSSRSGKATVYNSRLIKTIASQFDLDFSKCTSLSFHRYRIKNHGRILFYFDLI
ncbi:hypothetical protein [Lysinibacillus sp. BW-2-10]|uniref:hypothetical protein n=1 Tax=Lysinibacillus sp. BW-2-10 TaxID=2590030 RepID=UPI00164339EC|nr:hypothetical protein [Lysinibacillus sp. BW-2-10]